MELKVGHCCTIVCCKSLRNIILGMEKKMETTIVHWGYLGIMYKKMDTNGHAGKREEISAILQSMRFRPHTKNHLSSQLESSRTESGKETLIRASTHEECFFVVEPSRIIFLT